MIEQLTACEDWWDKFAKNLTSKRGADDAPFLPVGKKHKGGSSGSANGASGSGYGNGGARNDNRQERGRPEQREYRSDNRSDSRGGGNRDGDRRRNPPAPDSRKVTFGKDRKEDENPFLLKYHTSPVYQPKHSIWVIDSSPEKRQSLSAEGRCFLCKDKGHSARDCPRMEKLYADRKACYYQRK
jgi:hypothetical protein